MFIRSAIFSVALSWFASMSPAWYAGPAPSASPAAGTSITFGPSRFLFTIAATKAAQMSADVTTKASSKVMHSQASWLPVLYCFALEAEMRALFKKRYGTLGQRIKVK